MGDLITGKGKRRGEGVNNGVVVFFLDGIVGCDDLHVQFFCPSGSERLK